MVEVRNWTLRAIILFWTYTGPKEVRCFAYWGRVPEVIDFDHWTWIPPKVEALKFEIRELNTEVNTTFQICRCSHLIWLTIQITNLKESLEAERKHGLLMKFANVFLRSADHARLQEVTRKKEEYEGKLRVICGLSSGI
jgi:hypothetical protein